MPTVKDSVVVNVCGPTTWIRWTKPVSPNITTIITFPPSYRTQRNRSSNRNSNTQPKYAISMLYKTKQMLWKPPFDMPPTKKVNIYRLFCGPYRIQIVKKKKTTETTTFRVPRNNTAVVRCIHLHQPPQPHDPPCKNFKCHAF